MPLDGIFCDLLWADPLSDEMATVKEFTHNNDRECSYLFGREPAKTLLDNNDLMTILRGH